MHGALDRPRNGNDCPSNARRWIATAFNSLVLGRRYETLSVGEVSRRAGVGRSTFYDHFRGKDDVLRHVMLPILAPLADAAVGVGVAERVQFVLDHLAENRGRAMEMLDGSARKCIEQTLAELVLARLRDRDATADSAERTLEAVRLAGSHVAVLREWLRQGRAASPSSRVAEWLVMATPGGALRRPR